MRLTGPLPEKFLRLMSAADRELCAPGQLTSVEAVAKLTITSERQLQSLLVGLLRIRGIEPLWFRTDRRTRSTIGWPDITFAIHGRPMAWEVKMPGEKPRPEQVSVHELMRRTGWGVHVITSFLQGKGILDDLDAAIAATEREIGT